MASTVTIADTGATLDLNFSGTDTVEELFIGATPMANGVYKASGQSGSGHRDRPNHRHRHAHRHRRCESTDLA